MRRAAAAQPRRARNFCPGGSRHIRVAARKQNCKTMKCAGFVPELRKAELEISDPMA